MQLFRGIAASKGYAIGKLQVVQNMDESVTAQVGRIPEEEFRRFRIARMKALESLKRTYRDVYAAVGEEFAVFFQIHMAMLEDEDYTAAIYHCLEQEHVNAEYAVWKVSKQFYDQFSSIDDEYMRARGGDVIDIANRLLSCLNTAYALRRRIYNRPTVLAANILTISDAVKIRRNSIQAVVTERGSKSAHSAILARMLGTPMVVGLGADYAKLLGARQVIVDGFTGMVIADPDEETLEKYRVKKARDENAWQDLKFAASLETLTLDGTRMAVTASVGSMEDLQLALDSGAVGVGLFRSEFLFLRSGQPPTEDEQFEVYRTLAQRMTGRRVVIRTVDASAMDMGLPFLHAKPERNPALGYRGARLSLGNKGLLLTQLRAVLRASAYGRMAVMFPMLTTAKEVSELKKMVEEAKRGLRAEKIPFSEDMEIGLMIETPSAALISDLIVDEADFFCVGMNDFTQYVLAADPLNPQVSGLYDAKHPAVLRLLKTAVDNAKKKGLWVTVCGSAAADLTLLPFFLAIGVDEISVNPAEILNLRKAVVTTLLPEKKDALVQKFLLTEG